MESFNEEKFKNNLKWQMRIKLESDITNFWTQQLIKLLSQKMKINNY